MNPVRREVEPSFQTIVGEWAESVFTKATPGSIVAHLRREVEELSGAVGNEGDPFPVAEEAADCYLLLLHLAHGLGFDLARCAARKHDLNKGRRWGERDADGVVEHVE